MPSLDRLILAGNFDVEVLAGQAEIVLGIVQLVAIHGADLLIRILSGLEIIEDQLAVGVSRTIHNLVARTIKEPVGDACQRLLGVSVHLENFDAAGDQLVLTSNFQNLPVLIQYNRKSRIIQLISIRCLKLLAGVAAQLQIGERQLTIGVRVALCGSASRCVVQTETGTLKRGVRVRVHLTDLYTGFPQRIGARCGDIQCRSCNGDRVLGAIHHIPLRRTDLLIGIAAERQIRKDRLAICAGGRISDFVASAVIEPVGHTC